MNIGSIFIESIKEFALDSGFAHLSDWRYIIMIAVACVLLYLAIAKGFEPLLLVPIAFGMLLVNLPATGIIDSAKSANEPGGLFYYLKYGKDLGIYPPLIFVGVGAMTDFGPLIANPKSLLLGAAAQFGIFFAFLGALLLGFTPSEAASIGIIGGADGPTAIYLTVKLAPHLLGSIAVAAYSYMALVPVIQPPIMRALTTKEQRMVKMEQLRPVSRVEKIVFPIAVTIIVSLLLPSASTLIGMLMFGNLLKEVAATNRLADVASNALMSIVTILLGLTVGATTKADTFLTPQTAGIIILGLAAFCVGTGSGVLFGKIMYYMSGKKINPLLGAAGVSAVPMAARVVQKVGQEDCPSNFLLMHAMGPNVAGVIGSAIAAGILLSIYGN
ncbi:sodium ion-translocating decarboxylase subunit beta [Cellulosilyticum sp. I15G10I2]|uniref:sodium ion-translocating decarboxylase subunit beta n=1 Tax=Cellulosilyticum sp. I15G10I2 TaxID=1892843 RepID=UPI00085CA5EC|nr:sodium ion-translocating decarboxylase subunit beta [Cellulosilyticum sp. I15G10I2]